MPDDRTAKTTTLLFESLEALWQFARTLAQQFIHINQEKKTLTCSCSEDEVLKAQTAFKAQVIHEEEHRPPE